MQEAEVDEVVDMLVAAGWPARWLLRLVVGWIVERTGESLNRVGTQTESRLLDEVRGDQKT